MNSHTHSRRPRRRTIISVLVGMIVAAALPLALAESSAAAVPWTDIGHANGVAGMASINGRLFAATNDNRLWVRSPVSYEVDWTPIGHANGVLAMAAGNGKLYAVTDDHQLWSRDPVEFDVDWTAIGSAPPAVSAIAYANGKLFAATNDNKLLTRATTAGAGWVAVGHANGVRTMTSGDGKLYAVTNDDQLWSRDPVESDTNWTSIGTAPSGAVGLAYNNAALFAATNDDHLWSRSTVSCPTQKVVVRLTKVTSRDTEDLVWPGDELYFAGGGRATNGVATGLLTSPLQIGWGQTVSLDPTQSVAFDGVVQPSDTVIVGLQAYDEDFSKDWSKRSAVLDDITKGIASGLVALGPYGIAGAAALGVGYFLLGYIDPDDLLANVGMEVPACGPAYETRQFRLYQSGWWSSWDYDLGVEIVRTAA